MGNIIFQFFYMLDCRMLCWGCCYFAFCAFSFGGIRVTLQYHFLIWLVFSCIALGGSYKFHTFPNNFSLYFIIKDDTYN